MNCFRSTISLPFVLFLLAYLSGYLAHATIPAAGYSSYLGGRANDYGTENAFAIDVDGTGSAYVGGATQSDPFPATRAYGPASEGGFVVKVAPDGSQLLYSTYFDDVEIIAVKLTAGNELYALGHIGRETHGYINLGAHAGGYTDAVLLKLDSAGALVWGLYLGGADLEVPRALAVDADGNAYLAGFTTSTNFPISAGAAQSANAGGFDGFVAKVSPAGAVIYATYLGGASSETLLGLALDGQRRATVVGYGFSETFSSSPLPRQLGTGGGTDAFICRLNAQGSAVEWVTRLGGSNRDTGLALALDATGNLIVLGATESQNFPVTNSLIQTNLLGQADLYLARISADGQELLAATYFGSVDGEDIGDPFYFEFTLNGVLEQRTLFPEGIGLALGPGGVIHVASRINTWDLPAAAAFTSSYGGSRDAYFARFNSSLGALLDFRFFGGATDDELRAIAIDLAGHSYLAGTSYVPSSPPYFEVSANPFQPDFAGSAMDGIVIKVPAVSAALGNDAFAGRLPLQGTRLSVSAPFDQATLEPGEPIHRPDAAKSVWFTWQAPADGRVIASTAGSSFAAGVSAYSGLSLDNLSQLGSTDSGRLIIPVTAGAAIHFALTGAADASGAGRLSLAFSQPPNDDFATAATLSGLPVLTNTTNLYATAEAAEPAHDESAPGKSVWWKWTSPLTGSVLVTTEGSSFDTVLGIYTGATLDSLMRVTSHDDVSAEVRTSEAVFLAETGATYYIAVDGSLDQSGAITLRILANEPPANDSFATRSNLTGLSIELTASNFRATIEPNEPRLSFTNTLNEIDDRFGGATVWWSWTAPRAGRLEITTTGSDFDTRLGVYTGAALTNLTRAAASDDANRQLGDLSSSVEFDAAAGTQYFIQVDGSISGPSGVIRLNLKLTFPPRILDGTFEQQSGGTWQFQAEGVPGSNYRVEISTDLRTWMPITAPSTELNGTWTFTLPALNPNRVFIRLATIEQL